MKKLASSSSNFAALLDFTTISAMKKLVPTVIQKGHEQLKSSSFHIMANSNQTENSLTQFDLSIEEFTEKFEKAVISEVKNENNYKPVADETLSISDIKEIKINEKGLEVGEIKGAIHIHVDVTVRYRNIGSGYFHVDFSKLKEGVLRALPITDFKLDVKFVKPPTAHISNYVRKSQFLNATVTAEDSTPTEYGAASTFNGQETKKKRKRTSGTKSKRGRPRKKPASEKREETETN